MPPNDDAFESANIAFKIKAHSGRDRRGRHVEMDNQLPTASTCFFHLTLPRYTSLEIMTKRMLIAVHNDCVSMNAEVARMHDRHDRGGEDSE